MKLKLILAVLQVIFIAIITYLILVGVAQVLEWIAGGIK